MLFLYLGGALLVGFIVWRVKASRSQCLMLSAESKTHYRSLNEEWPILSQDRALYFGPSSNNITLRLITRSGTSEPTNVTLSNRFESPLFEWDPSRLALRFKGGVDLSAITYLSLEHPTMSDFLVIFAGNLEYRDGEVHSIPVFNLTVDNVVVPHCAPGRQSCDVRVHRLFDARLEKFLLRNREDVADGLMAFGCDAHLLAQAEAPQMELCSLIRSIVEQNRRIIWPHRDSESISVQDSSMFTLSNFSSSSFTSPKSTPPMHAVRQIGAYANQLHLDVNTAGLAPAEELRDHINVWLPLAFSPQDPLVFLSRHGGSPIYESDPGNFTHFEHGNEDRGVGAFLRPGEMFVWCPLLVPHASCHIPGRGPSNRQSAEFRFQCVSTDTMR